MLNCPLAWISPTMTGFVRWWFGCITSVKPDGALKLWPIIAWRIDVGGAGLFDGMRLHVEENIFGFGLTGSEPACACGSRENHRRDRFVADSPQEEGVWSEPVSEVGVFAAWELVWTIIVAEKGYFGLKNGGVSVFAPGGFPRYLDPKLLITLSFSPSGF
jgi:hypothetical protein